MSTLFGLYLLDEEIELVEDSLPEELWDKGDVFELVAFRGNFGGWLWKNPIAHLLPDNLKVYPLDNTAQGIYTIGDIKNKIHER